MRIWALPVRLHSLDGTVSARLDIVLRLTHGDPRPKGAETGSNRQGQGQTARRTRGVRGGQCLEGQARLSGLPGRVVTNLNLRHGIRLRPYPA